MQSVVVINVMWSRHGGLVPIHVKRDWVFPAMAGSLNMPRSGNTQVVSGRKYCKITQQCMKRQQEKLVPRIKSRECNWTGERIEVSVPISFHITGAGWTCYSLSTNLVIKSQTGCSSLATTLHKSELRCGPLATEINEWLNVSGTKQVTERAKHYTLGCWGITLA